jgi:hypothetical protein
MLNFLKMANVIIMGAVMQHGHKLRISKATMVNSKAFPLLQVFAIIKIQR